MLWCDTLSVGRSSISCLKLCVNSLPSKEGKTEPSRQAKEQPQRRSSKYACPHPGHNHYLILIFDFDQLTCNPLNLMTTQCGKENRTTINNGRFSGMKQPQCLCIKHVSLHLGLNQALAAVGLAPTSATLPPTKKTVFVWRTLVSGRSSSDAWQCVPPLQYFLCLISIVVGERGSQECNAKMETVHTYFVCICILYTSNYL